jgi:uridine kinase
VFDHRADAPVDVPAVRAADDALLLFDGVFLLRPELLDAWEVSVFVRVDPQESLRRALVRDAEVFGSAAEVERRYRVRYLPGQQLYLDTAEPLAHADLVLDNDDPAAPRLQTTRLDGPCPGDSPC